MTTAAAPLPTGSVEPYVTDVPLRWSDMDAYGHVNNVEYLRLLESARVTAFADWFDADRPEGAEPVLARGILLAHQEIEYLRQLVYRPQPLRIRMWVTRIGGASFTLGYEMCDPEPLGDATEPVLYAVAESTLATYDVAADRIRSIPAEQRAALQRRRGPAVAFRRRR